MTICKIHRRNGEDVHITPEMASVLVKKGIIECVELGEFEIIVDDELIMWKVLRNVR
jgi:hypothetical protein